jgi:hypothetical protein
MVSLGRRNLGKPREMRIAAWPQSSALAPSRLSERRIVLLANKYGAQAPRRSTGEPASSKFDGDDINFIFGGRFCSCFSAE